MPFYENQCWDFLISLHVIYFSLIACRIRANSFCGIEQQIPYMNRPIFHLWMIKRIYLCNSYIWFRVSVKWLHTFNSAEKLDFTVIFCQHVILHLDYESNMRAHPKFVVMDWTRAKNRFTVQAGLLCELAYELMTSAWFDESVWN